MLPQISQENTLNFSLPIVSNSLTFPKLIEMISDFFENIARNLIQKILETVDYNYYISEERKERYYVKVRRKRTIITMFGEVTYTRTIYSDKLYGNCYTYVDRVLGIDRYIHYTNDVASYAYEAYSDENSMIKVGKELGSLIKGKYKIEKNSDYCISRQSISNLIHRPKGPVRIKYTEKKKEVDSLYLLLDEKYIPYQTKNVEERKENNNFMNKVALIVEGLNTDNPKRHYYINPYYYSSYSTNFSEEIMDIISERYNLDKLKHIHVLSDGGSWCKSLKTDLRFFNIKVTEYTDKYHAFNALWELTLDDEKYHDCLNLLLENKKSQLLEYVESLEITESKEDKKKYLLNNWNSIQRMVNLKDMNCAMEQVISHHVASQFTSVGKAYNKEHINFYHSMRDNYRNNENMKEVFLKALDRKDLFSKINEEGYDFSMFDKINAEHSYSILTRTGTQLKIGHF